MILESATLIVKPGFEENFEQDFKEASQYISSIPGYISHVLHKCIEIPNQYLLLVYWNSLEDHEIGFRQSEVYQKWKKLLHHYYDPFPEVLHFGEVFKNSKER